MKAKEQPARPEAPPAPIVEVVEQWLNALLEDGERWADGQQQGSEGRKEVP